MHPLRYESSFHFTDEQTKAQKRVVGGPNLSSVRNIAYSTQSQSKPLSPPPGAWQGTTFELVIGVVESGNELTEPFFHEALSGPRTDVYCGEVRAAVQSSSRHWRSSLICGKGLRLRPGMWSRLWHCSKWAQHRGWQGPCTRGFEYWEVESEQARVLSWGLAPHSHSQGTNHAEGLCSRQGPRPGRPQPAHSRLQPGGSWTPELCSLWALVFCDPPCTQLSLLLRRGTFPALLAAWGPPELGERGCGNCGADCPVPPPPGPFLGSSPASGAIRPSLSFLPGSRG